MESDGRIYHTKPRDFQLDLTAQEQKWRREVRLAAKRRVQSKVVINSSRRAALGRPPGWPSELFTVELSPPETLCIPEPAPAKPDYRLLDDTSLYDPFTKFNSWRKAQTRSPEEDQLKAMLTEVTTAMGDNESVNNIDELYERIDEEDVPAPAFNFKAAEDDKLRREEQRKLRHVVDSHLLAQVFDSCPLQGEVGLAASLGEFFPWMLDAGESQAAHTFWHGEEVCPQLQDHWSAEEFRAEKLFVPVDRANATFKQVISLWKELDELAAERKRAVAAYYCCFALFYGQKPNQSAHVEHSCLRHDLDKRIISKPSYDHAEDANYDSSVNTVKKILGFVKEQSEGLDETDAYLHAWKRFAGKGRWWFTDSFTGQEWIAVPWLWRHTEPTESSYLKHFDRCFADEHFSIYRSRPQPAFKANPEAVFEIKASVLARRSACLHTTERSFQEVAEIVWGVLFKQNPDEAKRQYDQAVQELAAVRMRIGDMFDHELQNELDGQEDQLLSICRQFPKRVELVFRAVSIVFERAPKKDQGDDSIELVISSERQKSRKQIWRDSHQTAAQKGKDAEKHAAADKLRRQKNPRPASTAESRQKERLWKAAQRAKAAEKIQKKGMLGLNRLKRRSLKP